MKEISAFWLKYLNTEHQLKTERAFSAGFHNPSPKSPLCFLIGAPY